MFAGFHLLILLGDGDFKMLTKRQVEIWMVSGETELAKKHWLLISEECHKYGTPELPKDRKVVGDAC